MTKIAGSGFGERNDLVPMILYGLTGGPGMGKSTAARLLRERGVPVADSDSIARDLVEPGQPALAEIREVFGSSFIDSGGQLRRKELAEFVFADESARRGLERILHPRIRAVWLGLTEQWRREKRSCAVVVIPLLFEIDAAGEFDVTVCVACSSDIQRERLRQRGWTDDEIRQRLNAQLPIRAKMDPADHVLWNDAGLDVLKAQIDRIG